ncbi:MAG TPA: polysaccharide deacetylase family protein [Chroococcidiopsis sp.]
MIFVALKNKELKRSLWILLSLLSLSFVLCVSLAIAYITAPRIPVLGFHAIYDLEQVDSNQADSKQANTNVARQEMSSAMNYSKQNLEQIVDYLVRENYWFLTTQELLDFFIERSQPIPPEHRNQRPIMLSFDDSYKSIYSNVIPILETLEKRYGRKAKVVSFVNPGTLATADHPSTSYLSCEDLRQGFAKGFYDIQSHGLKHRHLTQLSQADLLEEVAQAQVELKKCLSDLDPNQTVATHFAYPFGETNAAVESVVSTYYQSAYLYNSKILRFCHLRDRFLISRLSINQKKDPARVIQMAERSRPIQGDNPC